MFIIELIRKESGKRYTIECDSFDEEESLTPTWTKLTTYHKEGTSERYENTFIVSPRGEDGIFISAFIMNSTGKTFKKIVYWIPEKGEE